MAEDDQRNAPEGDDEPQISVPSHDPLPPPPEIHYTRPTLGKKPDPTDSPTDYRMKPQAAITPAGISNGIAGGTTLIGCIFGGYWLGSEIDSHWLHTQTPWATIVMILAGTFAGFYNMFRLLKRAERLNREK